MEAGKTNLPCHEQQSGKAWIWEGESRKRRGAACRSAKQGEEQRAWAAGREAAAAAQQELQHGDGDRALEVGPAARELERQHRVHLRNGYVMNAHSRDAGRNESAQDATRPSWPVLSCKTQHSIALETLVLCPCRWCHQVFFSKRFVKFSEQVCNVQTVLSQGGRRELKHLRTRSRHPEVAADVLGGRRARGARRADRIQQRLRQAHQLIVRDTRAYAARTANFSGRCCGACS